MNASTNPEPVGTREALTRRRFEHLSLLLLPLLYGLLFLAGALLYLFPPRRKKLPPKEIGSVGEYLRGKVEFVDFHGRKVWVLADAGGKAVLAIKPRCPHLYCNVKWESHKGEFKCPCHGMRFGRDGKYLEGPTRKDLTFQPIEIREGQVVLLDDGEV